MATTCTVHVKQKNIERLIARCENILSGKTQFQGKEWKLTKYVYALDDQIREFEKFPSVDQDLLKTFQQRVGILHDVIRTESESHPHPGGHIQPVGETLPCMPHTNTRGSELLRQASVKREKSMRDQLFSTSRDEDESDLRQQGLDSSIETVLHRHHKMQDDIAEDMVRMARSLKNHSIAAKEVIIKDNKNLRETATKAVEHTEGVDRATNRLKEANRGCSWGIWILLMFVFIVFVAMVLFIRIVPKPR